MEGWKSSVVLAFLLVAAVSADGVDKCQEVNCLQYPPGAKVPCPSDDCGYCCCIDGPSATYHKCHREGRYNPDTQQCEGENQCGPCSKANCTDVCLSWMDYPTINPFDICGYCECHPDGPATPKKCDHCGMRYDEVKLDCVYDPTSCPCPNCDSIKCPGNLPDNQEIRYSNPSDPCGFCCCEGKNKVAVPRECPFHEKYDCTVDDCVPDPTHTCPHTTDKPPTGPPPTHSTGVPPPPPPYNGCEGAPCPVDPTGSPLYPCGGQPQYFCQCDWGGRVHQMPCAGGTIFNYARQTCL